MNGNKNRPIQKPFKFELVNEHKQHLIAVLIKNWLVKMIFKIWQFMTRHHLEYKEKSTKLTEK